MIPRDISRYKGADCTLFRTPPLVYTRVDKAIEEAIIQAWKQGANPQNALDSLAASDLLNEITLQIEQSLRFQREQAIQSVQVRLEEQVQEYEVNKSVEIGAIDSNLGGIIHQRKIAFEKVSSEADAKRLAYDAVNSSLAQIRERVDEKLKKVGGSEGYEALSEIKRTIQAHAYSSDSAAALTARIAQGSQQTASGYAKLIGSASATHLPLDLNGSQSVILDPAVSSEPIVPELPEESNLEHAVESLVKKNFIQKFVLAVYHPFGLALKYGQSYFYDGRKNDRSKS